MKTKLQKNNDTAIDSIIKLMGQLRKLNDERAPIIIRGDIVNTGLVKKPMVNYPPYSELMDLGGRDIDIHIEIPNKSSVSQRLKELVNEKNKQI